MKEVKRECTVLSCKKEPKNFWKNCVFHDLLCKLRKRGVRLDRFVPAVNLHRTPLFLNLYGKTHEIQSISKSFPVLFCKRERKISRLTFPILFSPAVSILLFVAGVSCSRVEPVVRFEGFALGTVYSVSVKGAVPEGLEARIDSVFSVAEGSMSVFDKGSLLSRLNRNETDSVDVHIGYCLDMARQVSDISGGRYDVTVLPLVEAYGFSGGRRNGKGVTVDVDSLLPFVGYEKVDVLDGRLVKQHPLTRIDLNSIAKGYTVDLLARMLEGEGVSEYLVNVGGEVFCRGTNAKGKPWVIGIETPVEGNYVQGASVERMLSVSGMGVATSGNYRNFHTDSSGRKYTHIVDPVTGTNTETGLLSASVVAGTCAMADALGTMFIALGLEEALGLAESRNDIAVLLIFSDDQGRMMTFESKAMKAYLAE